MIPSAKRALFRPRVLLASARVTFALARFASALRALPRDCCTAELNRAGSIWAMGWPFFTCELKSTYSLEMVPETWVPTWTVTTAFKVPVAETEEAMEPRSTLSVLYCALGGFWK